MNNDTVLLEIKDTDFNTHSTPNISQYNLRTAARGLVISKTKLAILFVSKYNYYKLPGGGIELDETIEEAFCREVVEEVGCKLSNLKQYGKIIEFRDQFKLKQVSYILTGQVEGEIGTNNLEPSELEEGFKLMWTPIKAALQLMSSSKPSNYEGQFIVKRDLYILNHCLPLNK